MFEVSHENLQGQDIVLLGAYRPWNHHTSGGGSSADYPKHSGRILDLKQGLAVGIDHFFDFMAPRIKSAQAIAVVPSHDPGKLTSGIRALGMKLSKELGLIDATACLVRHQKIEKLAHGGDRSVEVHLGSIHVQQPEAIQGRQTLILDDVMTTGNSLLACRQLILQGGAEGVKCIALGRTTY